MRTLCIYVQIKHTHTYEFTTTTSEFCKNIEKGDLYSRRLILYKRVYATKENNNIHFFLKVGEGSNIFSHTHMFEIYAYIRQTYADLIYAIRFNK